MHMALARRGREVAGSKGFEMDKGLAQQVALCVCVQPRNHQPGSDISSSFRDHYNSFRHTPG